MAENTAIHDVPADPVERWHRARNPRTPGPVLEALARDESEFVRREVAWNPSTPVPVLEELAKDEDGYVRLSLALNPSTPGPVLEALANGDDEYVRREAQGSLDALRAAAVDPAGRVRIAPARGTDGIEH